MMIRVLGAAGAALFATLLCLPASAQTTPQPGASPSAATEAPSADAAKPARRSRAKSTAAGTQKEPTAGQLAARERQRKCAAEWKSAKAAGTVETGVKWPQYWSRCNARLKGDSA